VNTAQKFQDLKRIQKKKILIVSESPNFGYSSSVWTRYAANYFSEKYKVSVFCPEHDESHSYQFTVQTPQIDEAIKLNKKVPAFGDEFGIRSLPAYCEKFNPDAVIYVGHDFYIATAADSCEGDFARIAVISGKDFNVEKALSVHTWLILDIDLLYGIDDSLIYRVPDSRRKELRSHFSSISRNSNPELKIIGYISGNDVDSSVRHIMKQVDLVDWNPNHILFLHVPAEGDHNIASYFKYLNHPERILWNRAFPNKTKLTLDHLNVFLNTIDSLIVDDKSTILVEASATGTPVIPLYNHQSQEMIFISNTLSVKSIGLLEQSDLIETEWKVPSLEIRPWNNIFQNFESEYLLAPKSDYGDFNKDRTKRPPDPSPSMITVKETPEDTLKVLFISTFNKKCGIAEYTKDLTTALAKQTNKITIKVLSETYNIGIILKAIIEYKPHIVHFEHEYGIMLPPQILIKVIQEIKKRGPKVVFTFHTEGPFINDVTELADLIFAHGALRAYSSQKILKVGHPINIWDKLIVEKSPYTIIGTTGFIAPVKELDKCAKEFIPYLEEHKDLVLYYITAIHSSPAWINNANKIIENINSLEMSDDARSRLWINTNFLDSEELRKEISKLTLGFSWVPGNLPSNSGSAARLVANRIPTVCRRSSHFSHLISNGLVYEGKNDLKEFVQELVELAYDNTKLKPLMIKLDSDLFEYSYEFFADLTASSYRRIVQ